MSSMSELFELLDKLQSSRLDDQRCEMPTLNRHVVRPATCRVLDKVLENQGPYPQVVVEGSSYWLDPGDQEHPGDEYKPALQEQLYLNKKIKKSMKFS